MMQAATDPLAGLRDYHLPAAAHWWPPAPGWWILAAVLLLIALGLWLHRRGRQRRGAAEQLALAELRRLSDAWRRQRDTPAFLREQAMLVRRYMRARYPADDATGLCGERWLAYLRGKYADTPGGQDSAPLGRLGSALVQLPYLPNAKMQAADPDIPALAKATEAWIRCQAPRGGKRGAGRRAQGVARR